MEDGAPHAPAGWYDVSSGGKRYWDGYRWTADVTGAPSPEAEFAALDPYLPAPTAPTLVIPPQPPMPYGSPTPALNPPMPYGSPAPARNSSTPPGWYPSANGAMQWWDGAAWGPLAPPHAVTVRPVKETGIAYLFWILLGGFAAHRFYLGLTGSAIGLAVLWIGGWLLTPVLIGIPMVIVGGIWLFVDLFLIPGLVRTANAGRGYYS